MSLEELLEKEMDSTYPDQGSSLASSAAAVGQAFTGGAVSKMGIETERGHTLDGCAGEREGEGTTTSKSTSEVQKDGDAEHAAPSLSPMPMPKTQESSASAVGQVLAGEEATQDE